MYAPHSIRLVCLSCLVALLTLSTASPAVAGVEYLRGDVNGDGALALPDAVLTLDHLFGGAALPCLDAADVDASGSINIADAIGLVRFLFAGGSPPAQPFPACGSVAALGCASHDYCGAFAPTALTYTYTSAVLLLGEVITPNVPTASGGVVDQYDVAPSLPQGLFLDPMTGILTGTPTTFTVPTLYTVTATNAAGAATAQITLSVVAGPITSFTYDDPAPVYAAGHVSAPLLPIVAGGPPTGFSVAPPLPAGLSLDPISGRITGVPVFASSATTHVVTVTSAVNTMTTSIVIEILPAATSGFHATAPMQKPRYGHTATTLQDGTVLVVGGSDDRHFSSLEQVEIFDPTLSAGTGSTVTGDFVDLDYVGDPIVLNHGGRVFHTATLMDDGTVAVIGGSPDILLGRAIVDAEVYDPVTRRFNPASFAVDAPMLNPRFHHTASKLPNGDVLIAGGQVDTDVTIIDPNFPPGSPQFITGVVAFPSTESVEIFDASSRTFHQATDASGNETGLATARGRTRHMCTELAGFDNVLGTADDVFLIAGGLQTLSATFASRTKFTFADGGSAVAPVAPEVYDVATGLVSTLPNTTAVRAGASAVNLGRLNASSPLGVNAVGNILLLTNGDDDGALGVTGGSLAQSELVIATFTGFGPANGLSVMVASPPSLAMNQELASFGATAPTFGRTAAPAILIPSARTIQGASYAGGWVFTVGGASVAYDAATTPPFTQELVGFSGNEVVGAMLCDPFFNPALADPVDLLATTTPGNPTGVVGAWLNVDAQIPDGSLSGYGGPALSDLLPLVASQSPRVFHALSLIPGPDGLLRTADDRVLITGGGDDWINTGGAPSAVSGELFIQ